MDRIKLFALRRSWRLYRSAHTVLTAQESGRSVRVPIIRGEGLDFVHKSAIGTPRDLAAVMDRVYDRRSGALVDVGANVGQELRLLTARDRAIPYLGFEPNPFAFNYLTHFIRENGFACHWVLQCGLSDRTAVADLMFSSETDVSGTVSLEMRTARQYPHRTKVLLARGDEVIPMVLGDMSIALIKIDVEGEEPRVLAGLKETVTKHQPWLVVEVAPYQYFIDGDYPRRGFPELTDAERSTDRSLSKGAGALGRCFPACTKLHCV